MKNHKPKPPPVTTFKKSDRPSPILDTLWQRVFNSEYLKACKRGDDALSFEAVDTRLMDLAKAPISELKKFLS